MENNESEYMNTIQLAKMLNVSKRFIVKYRTTGRIPGCVKVGNIYRFRRSDIEKRMSSGQLLLDK